MKPPAFEYAAPSTLAEAVSLLASRNGNAKVISGGQSLMPMLAYRLAAPELLVDLRHLKDLAAIRIEADGVRLGAKVRWCDIENDRRLAVSHPLLAEAIKHVAHYQIRNRGTVGGSVAHADPSAEMPGVALTCDARMTIVGPAGTRVEAAADFFTGPLETSLEPDEILTEVHLPAWPAERRWAFLEFARRKGDFAMAGVALHYDLDGGGRITDAHIGAIGIADRPIRLAEAEAVLNGNQVTDKLIAMASAKARQTVDPPSDIHAPGAYRAALVATLLSRGLKKSAV
ncbi:MULTISPECIES: FAD binding domain-containing protein [Bradyrhizobium]|jgi:aerobic carbon-monoxide dehydrogenase medium subunit|uniref:Carbon-monoxide dehydrogenase medium subunit n=1 Tax=Bradyrhizobium elkanii TaxID=29448 RepID=A0ABV4F848_BRAEL|nr:MULTISPECIES: xanthine dehydrogenase family protein subunit M [Bradyrhizobium]MCP1751047.1 carbon-monoxide dehydrogenase medium subunit [Bradyrhizobium elkanii]MCP1976819.1 carbon-monoxide dehydrogenase medium subunit [Bradyrhizobium elkanii]MCS3888663.1 carbon-monoxide dehydrogenase medium subunit [Bradyrhizobium elkanii]MCS4212315.1 carbon-monoxide dehydrogenase medium subunit [Bradyrhizobium elkanii]MCW2192051.1 carbon-monoxide dehydrogenase medium subunit [Bradyrhizobium elkanii]